MPKDPQLPKPDFTGLTFPVTPGALNADRNLSWVVRRCALRGPNLPTNVWLLFGRYRPHRPSESTVMPWRLASDKG